MELSTTSFPKGAAHPACMLGPVPYSNRRWRFKGKRSDKREKGNQARDGIRVKTKSIDVISLLKPTIGWGWASNACSGDSDGNSNNISVRSNKQSRRIYTAHAFRLHRVLHQSLAFALMSALDGWTDRPADWSFEKKK